MNWLRILGLDVCHECGVVRKKNKMRFRSGSIGTGVNRRGWYISFCTGCIKKFTKRRDKILGDNYETT